MKSSPKFKRGNWVISKQLKLNNKPGKNKTKPKVIGKKIFQPININWSNLNLGKFARTKTNRKVTKIIFKAI